MSCELGVAAYLVKPVKPEAELNRDHSRTPLAYVCHAGGRGEVRAAGCAAEIPATTRYAGALVAEDNAVNQRVIVRLLEKYGHSVVVTGDGAQRLSRRSAAIRLI